MRNSFESSVDQFYSPMNQEILEKSIQQLNARKGKKHELIETPGKCDEECEIIY